jgi:hypothetical protein
LLHIYVGGSGAPTGPVTKSTLAWLEASGKTAALKAANEALTDAILAAAGDQTKVPAMIAAATAQRRILEDGPHSPTGLIAELAALPGEGIAWSFKPTGAGGEDAVLLLGPRSALEAPARWLAAHGWRRLDPAFTGRGAEIRRTP